MAANPGKDSSVDPDPAQNEDKNTRLLEAAKKGQLDTLKHLINVEHCDPMYQDENRRWTAIIYATDNGHLEVVQFLCDECGVNPKLYEAEYYTTLPHLAAENGYLNMLKYLIKEKHCDPKCRNENGSTSLHLAASHGHLQVVQYLIDECGMDPECWDDKRRTPLHYAAATQQLNILTYLIQRKKCDPMYRDQRGDTILTLAAARHNLFQVVRYLIDECGVDPEVCWVGIPWLLSITNQLMRILRYFIKEKNCNPMSVKINGRTILHEAADCGYLNVVRFLIDDCGMDPESCTDDTGRTVLHLAAKSGHVDILKYLINEKACDPMYRDNNGRTLLQHSRSNCLFQVLRCVIDECGMNPTTCWEEIRQTSFSPLSSGSESPDVLRYLIKEKHCDAMWKDKSGQTILHKVASEGRLEAVRCLIDDCGVDPMSCLDDNERIPLHTAVTKNQPSVVRYLVKDKKCDSLHADRDGWTPVHLAAYYGHLKVMKCLIDECGVDPVCQDSREYTPLYYAAREGKANILRYLIKEKHCDPLIRYKEQTVLYTAAFHGHLEAVKCLVDECGVDPKSRQNDIGYVVHYAAIEGHLSILKYLINEKHCDPMCQGVEGTTILHLAAYEGHLESVKYLIDECGVDPKSCLDDNGETPLHCAAQQSKLDVVKYLIKEKQCDPTLEDKSGKTALQESEFLGHLKFVKYLIEECGVDPKSFQTQLGNFTYAVGQYLKSKGVSDLEIKQPRVMSTSSPEEEKLAPSDLHQISTYLHDLPPEIVLRLGVALGLDYAKLGRLEKQPNFLLDMLSMWLREEDNVIKFGPPTWSRLIEALRDKTVSQNGIAQNIEKNHY